MSLLSLAPQPEPTEDDAYYRAMLHDLIADASYLAKSAAADEDLPLADRIDMHDRAARTIRRCIVLARHIAEHPARSAQSRRTAARKQVIRAIDDEIHANAQRRATPEAAADASALRAELCERLDAPEFDADLLDRPIPELITEMRRDLGLAGSPATWPRRTLPVHRALHDLAEAKPGETLARFRAHSEKARREREPVADG